MDVKKRVLSAFLSITLAVSAVPAAFATNDNIDVEKNEDVKQIETYTLDEFAPDSIFQEEKQIENSVASTALPASYSLVDLGYVTSVKNQGSLPVCWSFSALAALESSLLINGKGNYDFSEEHLNHWATTRSDNTGWIRNYSSGGFQSISLGYLTSWQGAKLEDDIPYRSADNKTFDEISDIGEVKFGVTKAKYIPNDITEIKETIYNFGAISTCYSSLSKYQNSSKTAVYCPKLLSSGTFLDGHSITVVGWDDNYSKDNFTYSPSKNGAWLVKNSWGNYNNLGGYFWISYEDVYIFNKAVFGNSYAILDTVELDETIDIYQNEIYGATHNLGVNERYSDNSVKPVNKLTYINKFLFNKTSDSISSVVFETNSIGSLFKVYFIPVVNDKPVEDTTSWILLNEGIVPYKGYHEVDITHSDLPYGYGAIGVTIDASNSESTCTLGCDEWLSDSNNVFRFIPNTKENSSYIVYNGKSYELSYFYSNFFEDDIGSNFVIKAITKTESSYNDKGDPNGDGRIDMYDALIIKKHIAEINILTERTNLYSADYNGDTVIDLVDALYVQKIIAKIL